MPIPNSGIGDYDDPMADPMAQYWKVIYGQPGYTPQDIVGKIQAELPEAKQAEINELARQIGNVISQTVQFVRNPAYLQPPLSADIVDLYKNGELALPPNMAVPIEVLAITVPDGGVVVIQGIANNLESPASFADVEWTFQINDEDVQIPTVWTDGAGARQTGYRQFQSQLGDLKDPTIMRMPFIIGSKRKFSIVAQNLNPVIWHDAKARLTGYQYIPPSTSVQRDEPSSVLL